MAEETGISWCDSTINFWIGCTEVSPGCDNCYARELMQDRWRKVKWGAGEPRVATIASKLHAVRWNGQHEAFFAKHGRRQRVFCNSLADLLDNEVPPEWIADAWKVIRDTPNLIWIVLTKRIGNAERFLPADWGKGYPNVILVASMVNQLEIDRDLWKLLTTPARAIGLSIEPMLGPIVINSLELDWVICGGESGRAPRPMKKEWALSIRDQCRAAGAPFFFKQMGGSDRAHGGDLLAGAVYQEWPRAAF